MPSERSMIVTSSLLQESDRGCVLIGAAILEEDVERLLRKYLRGDPFSAKYVDELFRYPGPCCGFAAKIQIAYLAGLYSKDIFLVLESIRKIRNEFAHGYGPRSFKDVLVKPLIAEVIRRQSQHAEEVLESTCCPRMKTQGKIMKERLAFILAVSYIGGQLGAAERMVEISRISHVGAAKLPVDRTA
jgi:DNA-binding MltR family transcriptional regulator